MPESSQDRDSAAPAPPPHPHARDHEEEEHEAVDDGDESTPFLPPPPSGDDAPPPAISTSSSPRALRILTALALTFSILTLVSLFATAVARQVGPVSFNLPWGTKDGLNGVLAPAIFSLLFSAFNLRRLRCRKPAAPLAINLIVDIVIAFFAITYGAGGLSGLLDGPGGWCSYPGGDYVICERRVQPVKVFAGIAMGTGIVFGAMHFLLFCVRCRIAYNSGIGRAPWRFPVGQLKFEVSIKFLREPEREAREEGTE